MYSFNFPEMIGSTTSKLLKDKEAVKSNLRLLISSERLSLFGDPYFGTALKRAIFEQPNALIVDLLIDEIYTAIITFIPQVYIERQNITIYNKGSTLYAELNYIYKPDNTSDLYIISLTNNEGY